MCECPTGYAFSRESLSCQAENGCTSVPDICGNGTCVPRGEDHDCQCPDGERFNWQSNQCQDINECAEFPNICGQASCINEYGDYSCSCIEGYEHDASSRSCVDVDECSVNEDICNNGLCVNEEGGFLCICPARSAFDYNTMFCVPTGDPNSLPNPPRGAFTGGSTESINECNRSPSPCTDGICINTDAGFRCQCTDGYQLIEDENRCVDINECASQEEVCLYGNCVNEKGSFRCECREPLTLDSTGRRCISVIGVVGTERDNRKSLCWHKTDNPGYETVCGMIINTALTYKECCCAEGVGWGTSCDPCPPNGGYEQRVLCETAQEPSGRTGSGPAPIREYPDGYYHPTGEDGIYAHGSEGTSVAEEYIPDQGGPRPFREPYPTGQSTGGSPPYTGRQPPYTGGQQPNPGGQRPYYGGQSPNPGGQRPYYGGQTQNPGGQPPYPGSQPPYYGGQSPNPLGPGPYYGGQTPNPGGQPPYTGGQRPYTGGQSQNPSGQPPYYGGQQPYPSGGQTYQGGRPTYPGGQQPNYNPNPNTRPQQGVNPRPPQPQQPSRGTSGQGGGACDSLPRTICGQGKCLNVEETYTRQCYAGFSFDNDQKRCVRAKYNRG